MAAQVKFYRDKANRWRWTAYAANGRKVGREAEGDGYESQRDAERGYWSTVGTKATVDEPAAVHTEIPKPPRDDEPAGTYTEAPNNTNTR